MVDVPTVHVAITPDPEQAFMSNNCVIDIKKASLLNWRAFLRLVVTDGLQSVK